MRDPKGKKITWVKKFEVRKSKRGSCELGGLGVRVHAKEVLCLKIRSTKQISSDVLHGLPMSCLVL